MSSRLALALGVLAALAAGAAVFIWGAAGPSTLTRWTPPSAATIQRIVSGHSVTPPASVVKVYECHKDGARVLSNAPCGPDAKERSVDVGSMNTYTPTAADLAPPAPKNADSTSPHTGLVGPLQDSIDKLNTTIRSNQQTEGAATH